MKGMDLMFLVLGLAKLLWTFGSLFWPSGSLSLLLICILTFRDWSEGVWIWLGLDILSLSWLATIGSALVCNMYNKTSPIVRCIFCPEDFA